MSIGDYERAANDLAEQCLAKFDDEEASLELRAFALSIVVSQINCGNRAMLAHVPDICHSLAEFSARMQQITGTGAKDFYRQVVNAVTAILDFPQENDAHEWFGPVLRYFVQLVSCDDVEIAIRVCEFWAQHADVLLHRSVSDVREWVTAHALWPRKLITALMDRMIFRDDIEPSSFEILHQEAESALENVTRVYLAQPLLYASTKLLLKTRIETRIESDSWPEKEAAIRALGAFTYAIGEYSLIIFLQ